MIRRIALISIGLTLWHVSSALSQPSTDIYLVELGPGGEIEVGTLANVTTRQGYDNQPQFLPDGSALLYTSIREDGQADAYRYDLPSESSTRLTRTAESEYSPTPIPGWNAFSVVRVEADSAQRLWAFSMDGQVEDLLLPDIEPVGYHAWTPDGTLLMGSGSKIFAWSPDDEAWREVADLGPDRIDGITRLAVSPQGTHLAVVAAVP